MRLKKGILLVLIYTGLAGLANRAKAQSDSTAHVKDTTHAAASPMTGGASPQTQPVQGGCPSLTSIAISASATTICPGTSVTFDISAENATFNGATATYNWRVNGVEQSAHGASFSTSALTNGATVNCSLSLVKTGCTTVSAGSNTITITVLGTPVLNSICCSPYVCQADVVSYSVSSTDATSYSWSLSPSNAGTVSGTGITGTVNFASGFYGSATLSVTGQVCNETSAAQTYPITVEPTVQVPSAPSGSTTVCEGASATYTTSALGATSYNWYLNGTAISGTGASNTITFPAGFSGAATILVSANGCNGPSAGASQTVTVTPTVGVAAAPSGATPICQGSAPLSYTTSSVSNTTGYVWSLSPSSAGSVVGSGTSGTVTWNSAFSGTATIGVLSTGCNAASAATTTVVTVQGTVGNASLPAGPTVVNNSAASTYTTTAANALSYNWALSPAEAGTLTSTGGTAVITWNGLYAGNAILSVAGNGCGGPTAADTSTVSVYLPLGAGTITPAALTIATGTDPGLLTASSATFGSCNGSYTYQWQSSIDGVNFSNAPGSSAGENYDPGNLTSTTYFRRQVTCGTDVLYTNVVKVTIGTVSSATDLNYIRTRTIVKPLVKDTVTADGLSSPLDVQETTVYYDDLGRPIQAVTKQFSPLGNDLVLPQVYDPLGQETIHYLPYVSASNDGNYKADALSEQAGFNSSQFPGEQFYYGQTNYEASGLNRTLTDYSPGVTWVGGGRGVMSTAEINTEEDSVALWNIAVTQGSLPYMTGMYPTGQLFKNVTTDEMGHQTIVYKDKDGLVVLKKVQLAAIPGTAHVGWLCTYYVYDNLNLLRFVIPPRSVELINTGSIWTVSQNIADQLCFRYEYDSQNRMIIKKVPGAGETHMVYDARDRLVMTQDSMLRSTQQWMVTTYDTENRPDSVGLMTDPANYNNLAYHTTAAMTSTTYPQVQNYVYALQNQNHYDDYTWVTALGSGLTSTMDTSYNSNSAYFITSYNSSPAYAVPITPYMITRGLATGTKQYLLGTTQAQYDVNFYDDHSRVIEVQSTNYSTGLDKDITQYDFSGKQLRHLLISNKSGNNAQSHTLCNEYAYDAGFRMTGIRDNIDGSLITVDTMQYNELGQLQNKTLGGGLDSLVYAYNIRGWLTGINKNFIAGTANDYFGMELAYDKQTSVSTTTYAAAQFAGNITGVIWKSAGDGTNRKYDFTYDNVNRLTVANFLQNPTGSTWNTAAMDYSVDSLMYDANGNILKMNQKGFKVGNPTGFIDQLSYSYQTNSNQLSQVIDGANDTASTLGDFHSRTTPVPGSTGYTYDGNGNLKTDNNKEIDSIQYNYLNLPQYIHIKGKGTITYTYDADGVKEAKIVTDCTQTPAKINTTVYIKSYQYTNDTLVQANFEEGRARWQKKYLFSGDSIYTYFYDYFMRDHLGNTRVILTTQKDTALYSATMEPATRATENALFFNIDSTSYATSDVPGGYPGGTDGGANDSVAMVSGSQGDHTQGPALLLKVMAGDSVVTGVNSYYVGSGATSTTTSSLSSVLNSLADGLMSLGASGGENGTLSALTNTSASPVFAALSSFLPSYESTPASTPKAYLNWMLLDNQFNYVCGNGQSGALPVGSPNVVNPLATTIKLQHSGYLYIWVSNETQNWPVFFDNLSVEHFSGPMLEETHYYPFGLTMAGISDKALKANYAENKYRFNKGSELQNREFSDGTGLEMYETNLRELDPQLGRWWQIDSKPTQAESPYASMRDNPISLNDPLGDTARIQFRTGFLGLGGKKQVDYNNGKLTNKDGSAYSGKVNGFLKQAVGGLDRLTSGGDAGKSLVNDIVKSTETVNIIKGDNSFTANDKVTGMTNVVRWDPSNAEGGPDAALNQDRPAFIGLGHELAHADDQVSDGNIDYSKWYTTAGGIDIPKAEIYSTHIENLLRAENGINLRAFYSIGQNAEGVHIGEGAVLTPGTRTNANYPTVSNSVPTPFGIVPIPFNYKQ